MKQSFTFKHNIRKSFGKIPDLVDYVTMFGREVILLLARKPSVQALSCRDALEAYEPVAALVVDRHMFVTTASYSRTFCSCC